ncbi:MAG: dihydrofolate reductase family protein [Acidimicrobiales bacterium]
MRQLFPTVTDVDPVRTYLAGHRPAPASRPWVALGMITSLDGATAADGRSGSLGGPADKAVFRAVRAMADVILVGAGTVRAEGYGPVRISEEAQAARLEAGRSPGPARLAIVTASLELDLAAPLFTASGDERPLVFTTTDADEGRVRAVAEHAEVRRCGTGRVDVVAAMASLGGDGHRIVVCEGGPTLNGALCRAGVVDEVCLSVSPLVVGGSSNRMVSGIPDLVDGEYELDSLLVEDSMLLGRWVRATSVR